MDDNIKRIYVPMTETAFYILLSLQEEMHGYNIVQKVSDMTNKEIIISAGTMYGTLSKMEKDALIKQSKEEGKRKYYISTSLGSKILQIEIQRIARLYKNSKGEIYYGNKT
ncbi:MAG: PadR family transcriptional regulator [Coprobacillaceae bacterium]